MSPAHAIRRAAALAAGSALLVSFLPAGSVGAAVEPNPWLESRVMSMPHSGGELEAPMNTLYAFERSVKAGGDMLELDVQSTRDGKLVVIHNADVDETTDGHGLVSKLPWRKVRKLDAAYWFVRGKSAEHGLADKRYKLRGARYGDVKVRGYRKIDFGIPSLAQVLEAFPDTPINIEIKGTSDDDLASYLHNADLLAQLINRSGRTDMIVVSFKDEAIARFHAQASQIALAPGQSSLFGYFLGGVRPAEGTAALQVPVSYSGIPIVTREFVERAHSDGYAVHVWFSGSAPDDWATYNGVLDACVDGVMAAKPKLLERILEARKIERPGRPGVDPCAP